MDRQLALRHSHGWSILRLGTASPMVRAGTAKPPIWQRRVLEANRTSGWWPPAAPLESRTAAGRESVQFGLVFLDADRRMVGSIARRAATVATHHVVRMPAIANATPVAIRLVIPTTISSGVATPVATE